jgi:CrcB protein
MALAVAAGGMLGSLSRHLAERGLGPWLSSLTEPGFEATFLINALGSFLIGVLAVLTAQRGPLDGGPRFRAFVITGLLGGFTTASLFSLQVLTLLQQGEVVLAGLYVVGSFTVCLTAAWLGYATSWPVVHRRGLLRLMARRRALRSNRY